MNPYAYAGNNPVMNVDPTGLDWTLNNDYAMQNTLSENWLNSTIQQNTLDRYYGQGAQYYTNMGNYSSPIIQRTNISGGEVYPSYAIENTLMLGCGIKTVATAAYDFVKWGTTTFAHSAGQAVYRVYGGDAMAGGASWSPINPASVNNYRKLAGLPSGGSSAANNSGRFVIEGVLQDTSKVAQVRSALPLDGNKGGIPEFIIPNALKNGAVKIRRVGGVNPEF